ncbi:MAG TPA: L,D-transpeptidase [Myxococcota bacterium]|nr:L,D-transpeptidase [Myxococcota bacterium]
MRALRAPTRALFVIALPMLLLGSLRDPGLLIEVDLANFSLATTDLSEDAVGPALPVAIGSPAHPTPTGEFRPQRVVRNPAWSPGASARGLGARARRPSSDGPLGVGKIPLESGAIQIHGGADPREIGKPVSRGCVSLRDESWVELVDWLRARNSLEPWHASPRGDFVSRFRRPIRVVVR